MMAKEQILKHIHAARVWLDKAQAFVENNNVVRGLSFLFLASAETQMPLRESHKTKTKKQPAKNALRIRPTYGAALAASFLLFASLAAWKYKHSSGLQLTAQRISVSEFTARLQNQTQSKASSVLTQTIHALMQALEEDTLKQKSPRFVALKPLQKAKTKHTFAPSTEASKTMPADEKAKEKTLEKLNPTAVKESNEEAAPTHASDMDMLKLVKIAEKTLKGQN